jgi:small-conductance mechanosensitive channel
MHEQDYIYWRAEVARLVELREAQQGRRLELQRELVGLDARRGKAAVAALSGEQAEREALQFVEREIAETRGRVDTCDSLLRAANELIADAKAEQRKGVAAELRRQAVAAEQALAERTARIGPALAELRAALGLPEGAGGTASIVWDTQRSEYERLRQRPDALKNAASAVERGLSCPVNPATGRRWDAGLW